MSDPKADILPLASRIALGYCPAAQRGAFGAVLALDHRLSQLVARSSEPMLGQMRLAWWRETLQQPKTNRPRGDPVLDAICDHWPDDCSALVAVVDGWEYMLRPAPLDEQSARLCAAGRAQGLVAACIHKVAFRTQASEAATVWALADLAAKVSDPKERAMLVALGSAQASERRRLPAEARSLAVLAALGARSLKRGGRPLMEGRGAALAAATAAILLR